MKGGFIMFARVTTVQFNTDKLDDMVKLFQESVVPAAQAQNGSQGLYFFTDRKTGKGLAISLWDSEENAVANEKSGYYQEQVGKFKDYFTAPPVAEGYEVSVKL
jgi:hypothetical protein